MDVPVELSQIIINESSDQQVIVLRDPQDGRVLPIVIGIPEILAINRNIKGVKNTRPMTQDLLLSVIEALDAKIKKVTINDLRHHTYFAVISMQANGRLIEIDSRPSDAIALAAASTAPIFVSEHVFEQSSQ